MKMKKKSEHQSTFQTCVGNELLIVCLWTFVLFFNVVEK